MGLAAYFQQEMPVFQHINKHLDMPHRDTVKTQSRDTRHDETWKLETRAKTTHTSVETETRPRHEKPCRLMRQSRDKTVRYEASVNKIVESNCKQST